MLDIYLFPIPNNNKFFDQFMAAEKWGRKKSQNKIQIVQ